MGRAIHKDPNEIFIRFSTIAYILKSTNLSVHKHVQYRQTANFVSTIFNDFTVLHFTIFT